MSYKNLEIWQLALEICVEIHQMTLSELPKFEMYEVASQIRRSSKSVRSNIVEGYGRRTYKQEFLRFLTMSIASNDETIDHLEMLWGKKSLINEDLFNSLHEKIEILGKKINKFMQGVEIHHQNNR